MPLDDTNRPLDRTATITDAFAEIGRVNGTMPPKAKGRRSAADTAMEAAAWEYWVSSLLLQLAESRREKAKRAAIATGVLPDTAATPFPVGAAQIVYTGLVIQIGVKVVAQADRVNVPGLIADLMEQGFPVRVIRRVVKRHTRSFPGAHIYTATLAG